MLRYHLAAVLFNVCRSLARTAHREAKRTPDEGMLTGSGQQSTHTASHIDLRCVRLQRAADAAQYATSARRVISTRGAVCCYWSRWSNVSDANAETTDVYWVKRRGRWRDLTNQGHGRARTSPGPAPRLVRVSPARAPRRHGLVRVLLVLRQGHGTTASPGPGQRRG